MRDIQEKSFLEHLINIEYSMTKKCDMTSLPMVSIVIPTYGRTIGLRRAISSVLEQTYPSIEIIVVDDNKQETLSAYVQQCVNELNDARIRLIKRKTNGGGSRARNTGILASKGELVGFLDDDDYFLPEKIHHQVNKLINDKADLCTCSLKQVLVENTIQSRVLGEKILKGTIADPEDLVFRSTIFTSMFLTYRRVLIAIRGFSHAPRYQDKILLLKLMLNGFTFTSVDEILLIMTEHAEQRVSRKSMGSSKGKLERTVLEERLADLTGGNQGRRIRIRTTCIRSRVLSMEGLWWAPVWLNLKSYRWVRNKKELKTINKAFRRNFFCQRRQF